ncbi:DUF1365 domain-containing protein [Nitrincola schmidtii]|uniref:DUF1365 domain-containing protein n=1 Tax=Nitrincola schmidtii TaxID=1730894 RepID=UPI00124D8DD4|nr:DUF1365 domain-containing protein [Nitrincola schmidtii]
MSAGLSSAIYRGEVIHHRFRPVKHRFTYKVSSWLIDLDELDQLNQLPGFSVDKFNLFSFYHRDHGDGSDTPLRIQIQNVLKDHNIDTGNGAIRLLCYPRVVGYVFNPLSVFYCHDESGDVKAILYEVSNTFKQRRSYLIPVEPSSSIIRQQASKDFYVSPFMPMETDYQFQMLPPAEKVAVRIRQTDSEGALFDASFTGERIAIEKKSVITTYFRHPLMTLKVMGGIHWEALNLWRKGMKLQPRPDHPSYRVSLVHPQGVSLS